MQASGQMRKKHWWSDTDGEILRYWEKKPVPVLTLFTTNPTIYWPGRSVNWN
jgi:hypothetical protein